MKSINKLLANLNKNQAENILPKDFVSEIYLELNPDVKAAGVEATKHYLEFGIKEGRSYKKSNADILETYFSNFPKDESAFELFKGQWSSDIPGFPNFGKSKLFDDQRVKWWIEKVGGLNDKRILELGPLEGGHTYMLHEAGAKNIISIESNLISFFKCLLIKNHFNISAKFLLGDFNQYLDKTEEKFDLIICSGVLYHMIEPNKLLESMTKASKEIAIWTHYYDEKIISSQKNLASKFKKNPHIAQLNNKNIFMYEQQYLDALNWDGFCGGSKPISYWLTKESLLEFFKDKGMEIEIYEDNLYHPNGPAMTLFASY